MDLIKPAFLILKYFYENPKKNLKLILSSHLERMGINNNQGITRTVYGVVRKEQIIQHIVEKCSQRETSRIDPDVLILLKIGIYLLLFSRSYPDHAVVNEVVNSIPGSARKFLNANLRTIIKEKDSIETMIENLQELPIKYSVSDFLIKNLNYLSTNLEEDLEYLNREPRFHLRVNTNRLNFEQVREMLSDLMIDFKELKAFDCFEVKSLNKEIKGLLNSQFFYVQNTSSQLVSIIASKFCQGPVLDCCAAPGTKSVTLSLLRPGLKIIANDLKIIRTKLMQNFTREMELPNIYLLASDARNLGIKGDFDFIIVDAPCTSAGTLRKNPDLKLKIDHQTVEKNTDIQVEILRALIPIVKEKGFLLYSVCSFLKEETEDVLDKIIGIGRLETADLSALLNEYGFTYRKGNWGYYLLPDPYLNNDLFYISLLRKNR